jgi:hypothetical protein
VARRHAYRAVTTRRAIATQRPARSTAPFASASGTSSGWFRLRFERQEARKVLLEICAVLTSLEQEGTNLTMVLSRGTATDSMTSDCVRRVDRWVNSEARRCDGPLCVDLGDRAPLAVLFVDSGGSDGWNSSSANVPACMSPTIDSLCDGYGAARCGVFSLELGLE